jgi:plastocyanin
LGGSLKASVIIVVVLAIIGGGAVALNNKNNDKQPPVSPASASTSSQPSTSTQASNDNPPAAENTITYSDNGFRPATLTVTSGTKITIKNKSSIPLQFDSDPHPEHTDDPELNVGTVSPGSSVTITVTKPGSHGYHNHLNASDTGTIIVE